MLKHMDNNLRPALKTEWRSIALLIASFALGIYFFRHFPDRVPTHWNFQGIPDGYSAGGFAAFFIPGMMVFMYLIFAFLPYLDPRRERYQEFIGAYRLIKDAVLAFLLILFGLSGAAGLGYRVDIGFWVPVMVGALFAFLGLVMGKIKSNWFVGVRTPWTLSSEAVWAKTHAAAPGVMAVAGLLMAATAFVPDNAAKLALFILAVLIVALGLPAYSYLLFRREKKEGK